MNHQIYAVILAWDGLESLLRITIRGWCCRRALERQAFEAMRPWDTERLLEAAGYLIRGSQPHAPVWLVAVHLLVEFQPCQGWGCVV